MDTVIVLLLALASLPVAVKVIMMLLVRLDGWIDRHVHKT
jgi:hypothetical protein